MLKLVLQKVLRNKKLASKGAITFRQVLGNAIKMKGELEGGKLKTA